MGNQFGVVVIGRNEGERLKSCLASLVGQTERVVYVDSGSTDGSLGVARNFGVSVIELDASVKFTAARARNEGAFRLRDLSPEITYIQFVDGDCEVNKEWLGHASNFLNQHSAAVVVCGRLRERYPQHSIYNLMCDIEWDTPIGETKACGGIAMMRMDAFMAVGGFRADLIAGEEPELCVRLRAVGGGIYRIDAEMALHDAAITQFGQWWNRSVRSGHAYAEGVYLHGFSPERHWVRESRSSWFWGLGIPVLIALAMMVWGVYGLLGALVYPVQILRLALRDRKSSPAPWWRSMFLVLGKFPEVLGQLSFFFTRLQGKTSRLIEYK